MTRTEAIRSAPSLLPSSLRARFKRLVAAHTWGSAALLVLDATGRADLSDAIWGGK